MANTKINERNRNAYKNMAWLNESCANQIIDCCKNSVGVVLLNHFIFENPQIFTNINQTKDRK